MAGGFSGTDKRRFKRVPVDVNLYYKLDKPAEIYLDGSSLGKRTGAVDVSEGGIGFVSDNEFVPGTELQITFHLVFTEGQNPTITAVGKIIHCRPLPEFQTHKVWRIGVEFTKIDPNDRNLIADYVRSSSK